jgi:hypothetical protein
VMQLRAVRALALALALGLAAPKLARAQPHAEPTPDEPGSVLSRNADAVTAGRAALEAYDRRDWVAAYEAFRRAESLAHSPVFLLYMARAKERAGARLEALELYARVANEAATSSTPDAWRTALDAARAERAALAESLPSLVVVLDASIPAGTIVTLDGVAFAPLGEETPVEPGDHILVARHVDGVELRKRVTVVEGQKRLRVELGASAPPPPTTARSRPAASVPRSRDVAIVPRKEASGAATAAYVTGAVGVASLLFGAVTGTLAWSELRRLKDDCPNDRCDPADAKRLDSVNRLGTMADIGFAVGAAGLGASAVLFWFEPAPRGAGAPRGGIRFTARY